VQSFWHIGEPATVAGDGVFEAQIRGHYVRTRRLSASSFKSPLSVE
jgi:hypothetical protein